LDRFPTSADEMGTKKQDASLRETNSFMSGQTNSRKIGVKKLALSGFPWKKTSQCHSSHSLGSLTGIGHGSAQRPHVFPHEGQVIELPGC
jgi:hypothetical protein